MRESTSKLIIGYFSNFRSGSSLAGEAFNQNDESFYWFEPIKDLYHFEMALTEMGYTDQKEQHTR